MLKAHFLSTLDALQAKNRLLTAAFLILLALNIVNTISLQRARTLTQTVIVPIGGGQGMSVRPGHERRPRQGVR